MIRALMLATLLLASFGCSQQSDIPQGAASNEVAVKAPSVAPVVATSGDLASAGPKGDPFETDDLSSNKPQEVAADIPPRTTLVGNWVLTLNQSMKVFPLTLIAVSDSPDKTLAVVQLEATRIFAPSQLASATAEGDSIKLLFESQSGQVDFEGRLADGVVRGNVMFPGGRCDAAQLVPTNLTSADTLQPKPDPASQAYAEASSADDGAASLLAFVESDANSPLALEAWMEVFQQAADNNLSAQQVRDLAAKCESSAVRWGDRRSAFVPVEVAMHLLSSRSHPDVAVELLDQAEPKLKGEMADGLKPIVNSLRETAKVAIAMNRLAETGNDHAESLADAVATLNQVLQDNPVESTALLAMADYERSSGKTSEAMRRYAKLAVMPMMEAMLQREFRSTGNDRPLPSESLAELWTDTHGDTQNLNDYMDQVYLEEIATLGDHTRAPGTERTGNRVAIVELFTGAQCPPCVAADIATGIIEHSYSLSEAIVIRYHQHIPGPDPLANRFTQARFMQYQLQGTPAIQINGRDAGPAGGFLSEVKETQQLLSEQIDATLAETTPIRIELTGTATDGQIAVKVTVSGVEAPDCRLRMVLAEDSLSFLAGNGIRLHDMIVRSMPGGIEGIEIADGKAEFSETIVLEQLRAELIEDLNAFEQFSQSRLPVRPLDLNAFHFVAMVQREDTQEILQAMSIPVSGSKASNEPTAATEPAPDSTTESKSAEPPADEPASDKPAPVSNTTDTPQDGGKVKPQAGDSSSADANPTADPQPDADPKPAAETKPADDAASESQ